MNSNRSLRSNANIDGRISPNFSLRKNDVHQNRSSSPPIGNSRTSLVRNHENSRSQSPSTIFNDDDTKFHRIAFERCAEPPRRTTITDREKFIRALNYVGYDVVKSKIDKLWTEYDQEITFKFFQRILNQEKSIDHRTLDEAFQTLYGKDRKFDWHSIDYEKFRKDMTEKGDKLTDDEFEKIRYLLGTERGKIDIKKLTINIEDNKNDCRRKILIEKKEQEKSEIERPFERPNSARMNNNVRLTIDSTSKRLSIPPKTRSAKTKGVFFCEYFDIPENALYYSIGYSFEIDKPTSIWITIEPIISRYNKDTSFRNLDIRLLLFEKNPRSTDRRLIQISSNRSENKAFLQIDQIPKGKYEVVPVTFGGVLKARSREMNGRQPTKRLREIKKGNQFSMSDDYRKALEFVFDVFDFDENQQLDRQEYNLWTVRTTGDEITDEDWHSIRDHVHLDVDENVSREKFLKLNDYEVQDQGTTEDDLWNGLRSLGFNYALETDMMCQFNLNIHGNQQDFHLKPTHYVELNEIKKTLIKFLHEKSEKVKLNNFSTNCYNYHDECGSILFVENRSSSNIKLSIQITTAENTTINLPIDTRKPSIVDVRRDSSQIIWFAHRKENSEVMELFANIQVQ